MGRAIGGVVAGFVVWTVLWLGGNFALLAAMPDGFDEETTRMNAAMSGAALALSAVCSLAAGMVYGFIAKGGRGLWVLAGLLLAVGLGVQLSALETAPVWYHAAFLLLLAPVTVVGGRLVRGRGRAR